MIDKKLISLEDLVKFRPIAKSVSLDKLDSFIFESQTNDLEPLLGATLYYDFMKKFDDSGATEYTIYQDLLNGKVYTPIGHLYDIEFMGIKPMLAYYTLARIYGDSQVNITRAGAVLKNSEQSEQASVQMVAAVVSTLKSNGLLHETRVREFLNARSAIYVRYIGSAPSKASGVKFFDS